MNMNISGVGLRPFQREAIANLMAFFDATTDKRRRREATIMARTVETEGLPAGYAYMTTRDGDARGFAYKDGTFRGSNGRTARKELTCWLSNGERRCKIERRAIVDMLRGALKVRAA